MPDRFADASQPAVFDQPGSTLIEWWRKGLFFFLCLSVLFLGIGGVELPVLDVGVSAWSISRTTFFFWLIWKFLIWNRYGRERLAVELKRIPVPAAVFFGCVTLSLLPTFHPAGDYRYFVFGFMHYLMVLEFFSEDRRPQLLYGLLALLPGFLVIRGVLYGPSVFNLDRMIRFGYPLDHPNTAGYLFSMSIPLAIGVISLKSAWLRSVGITSVVLEAGGLILSYSRGAWIGSTASILLFGAAAKRYKTLSLLVLVLSLLFLIPSVRERGLTLIRPEHDKAINNRVRLMKDSFVVGLQHPFFGVGYGRGHLKEALKENYRGTEYEKMPIWHAHNVYIELFADTGLAGLGAFLWLLEDALYRLWQKAVNEKERTYRLVQFGILAAMVAFAVTGLGDVPFYHHETRIYFFTLLALAHLYSRRSFTSETNHFPSA